LGKEEILEIARTARALEKHFGSPQDVEWAMNEAGRLYVVQTRPLHVSRVNADRRRAAAEIVGYRILARGARASGGVTCGYI
jgi:pyruvate,water dikinase